MKPRSRSSLISSRSSFTALSSDRQPATSPHQRKHAQLHRHFHSSRASKASRPSTPSDRGQDQDRRHSKPLCPDPFENAGDRSSVVRTSEPLSSARDFGIGEVSRADAVAYLNAKAASSSAASFSAAANFNDSATTQATAERSAGRRRSRESIARSVTHASLAAQESSDAATALKLVVPLVVLAAFEILRQLGAALTKQKLADSENAAHTFAAGGLFSSLWKTVTLTAGATTSTNFEVTMGADNGVSGSVVVGVCLSVAASCMNALGLNLQRLGQGADQHRSNFLKAIPGGLNTVGVALSALSGITDLVSFGFAPQSLLAPFGAVTLVINLILAPVLHHEKLATVDIVATSLVCAGIALALLSSPDAGPQMSFHELHRLATRSVVPVYLIVYALIMAFIAKHIVDGERRGKGESRSVGAGYPVLAGMLGGLTTLSAKSLTELLKVASFSTQPKALVIALAATACFAVTQVRVLNRGLGRHSALFVVPLFSASLLLANLCGGGVLFDEFAAFKPQQLAKFLVGVAVVVFGVAMLATKEEEADTEEGIKKKAR